MIPAAGPWFDELDVGQVAHGPGLTLNGGHAALHQAIVGDRLALFTDESLARAVTGRGPLAHPALVWDVAIGQSTDLTQHVKANLFYRGLVLHRMPALGDTLHTRTEVVGLRENRPRPERAPTGMAALRIVTTDQHGRRILDFLRCAMIPLRAGAKPTGRIDDLDTLTVPGPSHSAGATDGWDMAALRAGYDGTVPPSPGQVVEVVGGDVVSSAPELARLTLNVAAVHHDAGAAQGDRLVYGGHTIGIALSQASRAVPALVTVVGWHSCDHLGPVREGDTLRSRIEVLSADGPFFELRSTVTADGTAGPREVLTWSYTALMVPNKDN